MNLTKLFETQDKLDEHIIEEKGLQGQDLLDKKILALQVELGELANEWRGFKFWKNNPTPRIKVSECIRCSSIQEGEKQYCEKCYKDFKSYVPVIIKNPLLEEYVDCLHFILSIGNDFGFEPTKVMDIMTRDVIESFSRLFEIIPGVKSAIEHRLLTANGFHVANVNFQTLLNVFGRLGKELGFAWEQIEAAYYKKNEINHARQQNGY